MLAFLFTDAAIEPGPLREILAPAADATFNAITIDGDTSTSDTLLLFATGTAAARGAPRIGLAARSAACELPRGPHRGAARSRPPGGEGRRGGDEVRHGAGDRRRDARSRAQDRVFHRQLAAGEDGDRRRGSELGPRRHGRRQGWRSRGPRQACHLFRRHPGRQGGRGGARPTARSLAPTT